MRRPAGQTLVDHLGSLGISFDGPEEHYVSPFSRTPALKLPLTNREHEVLGLLARRLRHKEIAVRLFDSNETVRSHVKHIYQMLHVNKRREAVAEATRLGLLTGR